MSATLPTAPPRRHPPTAAELRTDVWLAGGLLVAAVLSSWLGQVAGFFGDETPGIGWAMVYSAAVTLPLALRRRHPDIVLIVVAIAFFAAGTFHIPDLYVGQVSLFVAMYTVGAWVDDRRRATAARVFVVVAMFVWLLVTMFQAATDPSADGPSTEGAFSPMAAYMVIQFVINVFYFGGAYYLGDRAYATALARTALEERTAELERERELTAAQAVALDRVRIARELHDVVAHHVSAMGVQAGAARMVLERDPDSARAALGGVEASSRTALEELRQLLETLRTPDATAAPSDSTVRLSALPDLVAYANDNGLPTTFTAVGEPTEASELVQVNLYRIAQEALTNARRHAGPGATADVRLRYDADAVELEITNTGRVRTDRPGLGLLGMRERATASGGTLEAGPRPRGGFIVRARIPLRAAVPA